MTLVDVLHDRYLELARQEHDGGHREKGERGPRGIAAALASERQQGAQLGRLAGAAEDVAETVVEPERDKQPHRDEGEKLHQRLERDGGDQAFMALGGVEVAGAEEDGEGGEQHRDVESVVAYEQRRALVFGRRERGILEDDQESTGYRFQLQRDVGNDPDHGNDRHQAAQHLALAIARRDEVGDGGNAVLLADTDDLQHHVPPQRRHQRGPEVDRQEADTARCRTPYAAVKSPGRAVDRERQRVDVGVGDDAAPRVGALVPVIGDREQQPYVGEGGDDDDRGGEHGSRRGGPRAPPLTLSHCAFRLPTP